MAGEENYSEYGSFRVEVSHYSFERLIGNTHSEAIDAVLLATTDGKDSTDRIRKTLAAILNTADRQPCPRALQQLLVQITSGISNNTIYEKLGDLSQERFGGSFLPLFDEEVYDFIAQERQRKRERELPA